MVIRSISIVVLLAAMAGAPVLAQAPVRRSLTLDDLERARDVRDPQMSPDGRWVAYSVTAADTEKDRDNTDLWMTSWDGAEHVQLTSSPDRESQPRWSPDGKWLAFLSARAQGEDDKPSGAQVWVMSRQGGEARRLTERKGGVSDLAWSPDSTRLVLVGQDPDPEEDADEGAKKPKTKKPLVIDRYQFKEDGDGYLLRRHAHLYLLTIKTQAIEPLTTGDFDDQLPAWSPDGSRIAFVSKRGADPDRTNDTNIYVMDARPGAEARALTTWSGPDHEARPAWSPDGSRLAYLQGSEPRFYAYNRNRLAVVTTSGADAPTLLTESLDREAESPVWSPDGSSLYFVVIDDRARHLARVPARGGPIERLITGRRVVRSLTMSRDGRLAGLAATGTQATEVHALEGNAVRALSRQNDEWLRGVRLGAMEDVNYTTKDGTNVGALLVRPPDAPAGQKLPLILYIHGGPNAQDQHELDLESQLFAAHGYAVLLVNYRGSAGRDAAYQTAIYADWGNKEVIDLLAGVDHLVGKGIADADRLGIGGWSYGGILTNYTIATDPRFKAAVSGAGSSLQTTMYGTDQYVFQYDTEMGRPWKNPEAWMKVSYPFFKADRIKTPTLFLCGEKDFNVPIAGAEQMYQALRSEGLDTQLVVYPGQHHGLTIPSYRRDRLQRYLDWYAKYLKPAAGTR
jgi:dipeptidyl aminopeptidase/acylaminoacyl peptidase